jgi:hypothetical protein
MTSLDFVRNYVMTQLSEAIKTPVQRVVPP